MSMCAALEVKHPNVESQQISDGPREPHVRGKDYSRGPIAT